MSIPEETLDIQTPENVAFGYQVAGIGSRFLATLIDTVILVLLQGVLAVIVLAMVSRIDAKQFTSWAYAALGLFLAIFNWGYYILFEMLWNGQSPGKRWVGLRVIRRDGTPITLSEALVRNLARLVDFLPFAYGVGIIVMFLDKQSRRLGDLAASTLVVHDRAPISIETLSSRESVIPMPVRRLMPMEDFPFERLTNDDLNLIEDFINRRGQLLHQEALACQILNALYSRVGLPAPSLNQTDVEDTLRTVLHMVQKRQSDE